MMARRWLISVIAALAGLMLPGPGVALGAEPEIDIERIELTGVTAFPAQALASALEIAPGDRLERSKIVRSAEHVQALYRAAGYEQVSIRTQLARRKSEDGKRLEDVLEFAISEGKPTRIAEIRFVQEGLRADASRRSWEQLRPALLAKLGLSERDALNQDKVAAARRQVLDFLASHEYVGAKVDEVKVSPHALREEGTARWVTLEFVVRLGDRVSFGFRGNTVFNAARLLSFVEEQRLIGFGKDYIGAIRARIEDEYRSIGYGRVEIETLTFERPQEQERRITYVINEGPRIRIEDVHFDGNEDFPDSALRKVFFEKASAIVQHGYYAEKDVQKAAELVTEWMKSQGYLSAKLVTINTVFVPSRRAGEKTLSVRLTIYVYEWDQTIVQTIGIRGANALTQAEIKNILSIQEGAPLNLFAFSEGIEALKTQYRNRGYLGVRVLNEGTESVVRYSGENRFADISLELEEGPRFRASRVSVEGLVKTRESVVRGEVQFREGDVLEETRITDTEARLRRMGIFSGVTIRISDDPEKEGYKIVRIGVQEGTPGVAGAGFGLRNDLGVRVFGGVSYGNLWGLNHTIALDASANRRLQALPRPGGDFPRMFEYDLRLSYLWPGLVFNDDKFRPALSANRSQYIFFDAETISASASWERRLFSRPNVTGRLRYNLEKVKQFNAVDSLGNPDPIENQQLTLGSLTPELQFDLRDNPLAPTTGLFAVGSFEYAAPWLLSSGTNFPVGYWRLQVRSDYFLPLFRDVTWFFSFRSGFAKNTEPEATDPETGQRILGSGALPLIKQFALGGAGSLRGFREQELNDQDILIQGTQSYVNYRTQLDLPFSGALRFGPFLDAANLQHDTWSFGNLRFGAGIGFHYQTPVGPVNLDFGWKLDSRPEDVDPTTGERDRFAVYFSIGVI